MKTGSSLLINEPPLQLLPSLAVAIGVNEAIVLQQIQYWLARSEHHYDGRVWVYKTYPEWKQEFPFWSLDTIGRTVRRLEALSVLLSTDKYNKIATDRTKWYSIDYAALDTVGLSRGLQVAIIEDSDMPSSREPQDATLLPETTPETTPNTSSAKKNGTGRKPEKPKEPGYTDLPREVRDAYFEAICLVGGMEVKDAPGGQVVKVAKNLWKKWKPDQIVAYYNWRVSKGMGPIQSIFFLEGEMAKKDWRQHAAVPGNNIDGVQLPPGSQVFS